MTMVLCVMYRKTSFLVVFFAQLKMSLAILKVCSHGSGQSGVCLPEDDCYTRSSRLYSQCGRNVCCFDPNVISEECTGYARQIFGDSCPLKRIETKIIGGTRADPMEFPHMAAVGFEEGIPGNISWQFGGTVISPSYVLTAAHGFDYHNMASITKVLAGAVELDNSSAGQIRTAVRTIIHPRYKKGNIGSYDVALLTLDQPLVLSANLVPACLMNERQVASTRTAIATGWGKVNESYSETETRLRKVELEKISIPYCRDFYPIFTTFNMFHPSMICAGHVLGGKDTCQGDSGGPLSVKMENLSCIYGIIGVTAAGSGCGYANSPGIYSRISYHLSWIAKEVWLH